MSLAERAMEPRRDDPLRRLTLLVRGRPLLGGGFAAALARHEGAAPGARAAWAEAVLTLANVNAGPGALLALFRLTAMARPGVGGLAAAAAAARAAAEVCRKAGSSAARAGLDARMALSGRLDAGRAGPEAAWWRGLVRLAREAPGAVAAACAASDRIVGRCGTEGFEGFVAAGLRAVGRAPARQDAFFRLDDPEACRVLDRLSGEVTFSALEGRLRGFAAALWGRAIPLREIAAHPDAEPGGPRRAAVSSGIVLIPDVMKAGGGSAGRLYEAAVAHATAHVALGAAPFAPGGLKPVQMALVGLVEDARIEALARRRFPGLGRLWAPFHTAGPSPLKTAPALMARIARALFDPTYVDHDGIVAKARTLFAAEPDLDDPALSRRIGGLIGNDIGQMRIQFNARLHVVEPPYRDDNLGLWTLPPPPAGSPLDAIDLPVEAARVEPRDAPEGGTPDPVGPAEGGGAGRYRPVAADDHGTVAGRYPEWDRAAGLDRPEWATVRAVEPCLAPTHALDEALAADPGLVLRVERMVRAARVGRTTRLRRQPDGLDLDLDAAIDAATDLRLGILPDARIHIRKAHRTRDLAVMVLVDTSESTRDRVAGAGASVLALEQRAVAVLGSAMAALGDAFAIQAFASNGRDEVRFTRVKGFSEPFDAAARARLAGLAPGLSTRLGAALRHAGHLLGPVAASRRILLVLTDGAPSDIDVPDPDDLVEDARRAVLRLRAEGIDAFGITLDPSGQGAGAAVFGRANHMPVQRIADLPGRLSELYFRIARR